MNFFRHLWNDITESKCFLLIRIGAANRYIRRLERDLEWERSRNAALDHVLNNSIHERLDHANCRVLKRNDQ